MKKHLPFLIPAGLILFAACDSSDKQQGNAAGDSAKPAPEIKEAAVADSAPRHRANIPFEVKRYGEKKGDNELDLDYPISGNPALLDSIRAWLSGQLMDTYHGNFDDSEAFFRHYADQMGEDPEFYDEGVYTRDDFRLSYINDCIVTYDYSSFIYEGGAHEDGGTYGVTFLQEDGSIFNKECFHSYKSLRSLFIAGLKRYFGVETDEELKEQLVPHASLEKLAPPGRDPWIEKDGVVFSYTPYEIAPFSAGSPNFTIPYAEIEAFLTPHGKQFFDIGQPSVEEEETNAEHKESPSSEETINNSHSQQAEPRE